MCTAILSYLGYSLLQESIAPEKSLKENAFNQPSLLRKRRDGLIKLF